MHLLAECGNAEDFGEEFKKFTLKPQRLNRGDASALAVCVCFRVKMKQLNLDNCDLSSDFLSVLEQHIAECKEYVKVMHIELNIYYTHYLVLQPTNQKEVMCPCSDSYHSAVK